MTTPRAALHVAPESEAGARGRLSDLARDQDPLRRLEAELQSADGGHAEVERLYEKTWGLLEEAWSLMTECLVMRDGLLDACREIEQTMDAVHGQLGTLSVSVEPNARERLPASELDAANGSDDALAP
jgi:hypothetical protein